MNTPLRCVFGLVVLMWAGCATAPRSEPPAGRSAPRTRAHEAEIKPTKAANLVVISAVYGSGQHFADVTARVNDLLRDPLAYFWAKPKWLLADPSPGWNKALVIVYELDGRRRIFTTGEGGTVSVGRLLDQAAQGKQPAKKKGKPKAKNKDAAG